MNLAIIPVFNHSLIKCRLKQLTAVAVMALVSVSSAAEECNLHTQAGLRVTPAALEFFDNGKSVYRIADQRYLVVDGQQLNLSGAQQTLVSEYDKQVRALVPEVESIALEGIDLAIEGAGLVFDGLLGERNKVSVQLRNELQHLKGDVRRYFDSEILSFNRNDKDHSDLFGKYFETRVERIVETSVQDSIGAILIAVGKEMLSSGGNMEAFEARMDRFGRDIEAQMRAKAVRMEARGMELCRAATAVNAIEEQLRQSVPDIQQFDLIQVHSGEATTGKRI